MSVMETIKSALPALPATNPVRDEHAMLDRAERRLTEIKQDRERTLAMPIDDGDVDAVIERHEFAAMFDRKIKAAQEAVGTQRARVEVVAAENRNREQRRKHAAMQRKAVASKKRFAAIFDLKEKLSAELEWAKEHAAEFEAYNQNERPADLPFVPDAEHLLRYQPAVETPAKYSDVLVWIDASGREATQFREVDGERVPIGLEVYRKERRRVCTQTARHEPGHMPPRVTDLLGELRKYSR